MKHLKHRHAVPDSAMLELIAQGRGSSFPAWAG
jgi:hypothetical protein